MSHPRSLMALPFAAAAALALSAPPAAAATTSSATTGAAVRITPSPVHSLYLEGTCPPDSTLKSVAAMQRINWIWAPFALDNLDPKAGRLPKVLLPVSMTIVDSSGLRARHDLAPGTAPVNPTTCTFQDQAKTVSVTVTGTVVTIPKWLDALQPPIQPPKNV